jgi:hypothetical protein
VARCVLCQQRTRGTQIEPRVSQLDVCQSLRPLISLLCLCVCVFFFYSSDLEGRCVSPVWLFLFPRVFTSGRDDPEVFRHGVANPQDPISLSNDVTISNAGGFRIVCRRLQLDIQCICLRVHIYVYIICLLVSCDDFVCLRFLARVGSPT